jgi:hypothetical protein
VIRYYFYHHFSDEKMEVPENIQKGRTTSSKAYQPEKGVILIQGQGYPLYVHFLGSVRTPL